MPKVNPKHQRKRVVSSRRQELSEGAFPTRYLAMGLILVAVITTIIIVVVVYDKNQDENKNYTIQDKDIAKIHYKLWRNPNSEPVAVIKEQVPYQENTAFERNVTIANLKPLGLYRGLLGMKIGETKYIVLAANIDANLDGVDDVTGGEVLSYGDPSNTLYNTPLVYWVEVLNITKSPLNVPASAGLSVPDLSDSNPILNNILVTLFNVWDLF